MRKILDNDERKVFTMEKPGYTVTFTLLDMGAYVGHKDREWFEHATPYWETMFIDVKSDDSSKNLRAEFLIDSDGKFLNLHIIDNEGNMRVINSFGTGYDENHYRLRDKGTHLNNTEILQESFVEPYPVEDPVGLTYYYDRNTGKFLDDDGYEAPESILTNMELGNLFRKAAKSLSEQFRTPNHPQEVNDIEFEY